MTNPAFPPEITKLLSRRKRFIDQIEVLNIECASINKQIVETLAKYYGGSDRFLVFQANNNIVYRDHTNMSCIGIPSEEMFAIVEVRSNNSYEEIEFFLLGAKSKRTIIVNHNQFHSFRFV